MQVHLFVRVVRVETAFFRALSLRSIVHHFCLSNLVGSGARDIQPVLGTLLLRGLQTFPRSIFGSHGVDLPSAMRDPHRIGHGFYADRAGS